MTSQRELSGTDARLRVDVGASERTLIWQRPAWVGLCRPAPVPLRSAVNPDSIERVSIAILVERLGRVADARMRDICAALAVAVACSA